MQWLWPSIASLPLGMVWLSVIKWLSRGLWSTYCWAHPHKSVYTEVLWALGERHEDPCNCWSDRNVQQSTAWAFREVLPKQRAPCHLGKEGLTLTLVSQFMGCWEVVSLASSVTGPWRKFPMPLFCLNCHLRWVTLGIRQSFVLDPTALIPPGCSRPRCSAPAAVCAALLISWDWKSGQRHSSHSSLRRLQWFPSMVFLTLQIGKLSLGLAIFPSHTREQKLSHSWERPMSLECR